MRPYLYRNAYESKDPKSQKKYSTSNVFWASDIPAPNPIMGFYPVSTFDSFLFSYAGYLVTCYFAPFHWINIRILFFFFQSSPLHGETSERSYHSVNDFSGVSTYAAGPSSADTVSLAASMDATSLASSTTEHHELINRYKNHTPEHDRPMYRKDILYTGSIHNLPQYNNNIG